MRKLLSLCLVLATIPGFSSCDKEEDECFKTETVDAILKWTGDYALDGCGYFLIVGEEQHKPVDEAEIPDMYKEGGWEGTAVEVKILNYHKKIVASCQVPQEINSVKILEIRKK